MRDHSTDRVAELLAHARALQGQPQSTHRTDAPLRSALSEDFLKEQREAQQASSHPTESRSRPEKKLEDLFHETLKDIYYAERQILKALPKMKRAAQSVDLKAAFDRHLQETVGHVDRLKQVFDLLGRRAQGKSCAAIEGLIEEGEEIISAFEGTPALDAGLIAAAQSVEHYEITRYGTLKRWAEALGMSDAAKLLALTLDEESAADRALGEIAEERVSAARKHVA